MATLANGTAFVSPSANAQSHVATSSGFVGRIVEQLNGWTIALTIVLLAISYDQGASGQKMLWATADSS